MAAVVAAVVLGQIVGQVSPAGSTLADVESDTNVATWSYLNFHPTSGSGQPGVSPDVIVVPILSSVAATLTAGPATLIISQGAGTVSQAVTQ